jgi:hypothetical protein
VDPNFVLDLGQLLNTPATFGFWPVSGNKFVVQAWARDVDPETVLEPGEGGWGKPYYDWWFVDLENGDAQPVRGLARSLANNTLLGSVPDGALTWELTSQSAWRWLRWTPSTGELSPVDALEPSTSDVLWFRVNRKVYGTETAADYSETTLIELTAEGGPRRAMTAPGFLHGVARIR